ncbi:MAG: NAD(P)/FAD-dependent oxidoreductase [Verrucomicrobia bacterium]|nr:NAD(P)/FAD-dependent oxidoreductase [Verrucomicrobiota bacterium]
MSPDSSLPQRARVAVVGGGAAGFFAAIACAEAGGGPVVLLEKSSTVLAKVRISGGGRCNVTHACFEPSQLVARYPRGGRELRGAFARFQPRDTIAWFAERGVPLKTESDGRMFPVTDRSETIIECLLGAARRAGVQVRTRCGVTAAERTAGGFRLRLEWGGELACARLVLTTGSPRAGQGGAALAAGFGHRIVDPVPSLFTFSITDPRLADLAGLSVPATRVRVPGTSLDETGPVLVTHWGLSGPAILRTSAWGARELAERDYRFTVRIGWLGPAGRDEALGRLRGQREAEGRRVVAGAGLGEIPARLWERLAQAAGIGPDVRWSATTREQLQALAEQLTTCDFPVHGKSLNKDEFVTCGGVALKEVDFRRCESRLVPGLHFAGELLDLDGITGGFNFQAAWTTGWLAGRSAAED